MDTTLLIIGFLLMLVGVLGSFLPVLPGVPVSWLGLLVLHLCPSVSFNWPFIVVTGIVAIGLYVLDYIIPAMGTKRFGGSKAGAWGTTIGLIVGIFIPIPFGILIGAFGGALLGELVVNKTEKNLAVKAAFGSFLGFLASTFIKFLATVVYLGLFLWKAWEFRSLFF
ncbi:DUF456 domain-containing protein [Cochleicola gelatinilyticus]|uniref:DUF456 domain-containing protein n=1 Tax=Cochleicola gelatinilyticus TaxID=1763537 RepID=A0A167IR41_9FLAO|nr:DUF456 domain-containing protein [Cochleicola gelatinilyticus]OAB79930.1 hypothetical protein ULVI_04105 [Cochleicola gelatinilyticus]